MVNRKKLAECADKREIVELYEALKAIADANRLRILCLLFQGEKCVCDIEEQLRISQPLTSHHLSVLREAGLVGVRRSGIWSYYSLVPEAVERLNRLFREVLGVEKISKGYPPREQCEEVVDRA